MKVEQVNRVVTYELANVHYIFVRELATKGAILCEKGAKLTKCHAPSSMCSTTHAHCCILVLHKFVYFREVNHTFISSHSTRGVVAI